MKKITLIFVLAILVGVFATYQNKAKIESFDDCVAAGFAVQESYPRRCAAHDTTFTEDIGNGFEKINLIRLAHPQPNQEITSPIDIQGSARGNWFFEAVFPVKILGSNGEVLKQDYMQADGDWMSEDFVPFSRRIEFDKRGNTQGEIVLEKANASGLPEHDDALRVPVKF
ncbi:MAG: Gmad2 immunoglobulin-like domain-containing protein [bacterium]|nr:Gmad2 immunoglobulin-like domain-containing protein [bacterium]